jgi:hypothetical protein
VREAIVERFRRVMVPESKPDDDIDRLHARHKGTDGREGVVVF